ncbi:peptidoglycan-binding protein LysM [Paracoccaceae bacterium GXU_MW_L88]
MGLWNFVKEAGKGLFGGKAEAAEAPAKEEAIKKELKDLGLDNNEVQVKVDGDKVKVSGKNVTQEQREKIILAAGNVEGVATVEDDLEADDGSKEPKFHVVEKGDTLWAIAEKTLGNGADYQKIFEANKPMLSDPDKIYPGQTLRIPQD